ncbi:MAG: hypothetical protein L6Q71_05665 [Planctomycetes bacterium]|nr:hypothetical protein [Planctomycetota bacterium]NUQ36045.1 hypothetical protein [Planctomycetaceae bacterium]
MKLRPTHEALKDCIEKAGVKKVAGALGISSSLVYKWCQPPDDEKGESSGAANPLDRMLTIYELSGDSEIIQYLCRRAGGFFTENPHAKTKAELRFVTETIEILNKFADLMHYAERSLRGDGVIDHGEAVNLRQDWDRLKSRLEHFITACEQGQFDIRKEKD